MLWGWSPPAAARNQIQVHISHIRKRLREVGADDRLETRTDGYVLRPVRSDVEVFTSLADEAAGDFRAHRYHSAADGCRRALQAWSGPALSGLDAEFVSGQARILEEQRSVVFRRLVDLELNFGHFEALIPELTEAVQKDPLDDGLRLRLMTALQRSGRSADALDVYQDGRRQLNRELGLDPTRMLQNAETAVLHSRPIEHEAWDFGDSTD
ncbi:AfsR/SARP family transcriptional regulator [Cryptosporangium minutisporangium]|uniref:AfsR/SARP family transcriptional regulator n=2 Tax=Cryptosporangium minutisporangium TaxID=113569 RepID=A0ABP6SZW2_9ACTN